jgi:dipeptidyl aminopeptidase/acylaminoacyl peptidase
MKPRSFLLPLVALAATALGAAPAFAQAEPPSTEVQIWMQDVAVSPDGRTLAFSRYEGTGDYKDERWQVWVAERGGRNARQLLFYREKGDQQHQIWTLDLEMRAERRITDGTGHHFFPFDLPDGRMAWSGQPGPKGSKSPRRLWIREASGKLRPVGPENVYFARATPDGKEILYLLGDSGERRIYRLPLAGGEPATVVDGRQLSALPPPPPAATAPAPPPGT